MSRRFMDKMLNFMGFEEEQPDDKEQDFRTVEDEPVPLQKQKKNRGQVVSLHAQRQVRVVVIEPISFDDVPGIADNLKSRRPVIINLEKADSELAKRVVDFVSGTTYALDGSMQKVGKGIFLSVPNNVGIEGDIDGNIKEKGIFAWMK